MIVSHKPQTLSKSDESLDCLREPVRNIAIARGSHSRLNGSSSRLSVLRNHIDTSWYLLVNGVYLVWFDLQNGKFHVEPFRAGTSLESYHERPVKLDVTIGKLLDPLPIDEGCTCHHLVQALGRRCGVEYDIGSEEFQKSTLRRAPWILGGAAGVLIGSGLAKPASLAVCGLGILSMLVGTAVQ
jgi:hypothetical protein